MVTRYTEGQARSSLEEEALVAYPIPFQSLRNDDATVMDATGGAGKFSINSGGWGSGTMTIRSEAANNNAKTDTLMFDFTLPPEYVSAGDVRLVLNAQENDEAMGGTELSAEVYKSDGSGGAGADLCNAFDNIDITTSWQTCTAVVTATGLVAGDTLRVFVRLTVVDAGGGGGDGAQAEIDGMELQLDIKG